MRPSPRARGSRLGTSRFAPLALAALLACGGQAMGQSSDSALKDRVNQLVERLDAPKVEARQAAEKALVELGTKALPFLPETIKGGSKEANATLEKVRTAIRESADQTNLGASKVTIQGQGIRLSEALQKLQAQSSNQINDLREQFGADVTNPGLDLDLKDKSFFESLDDIATKAGLTLNFFTGDGSIGLMAGAPQGGTMPMAKPRLQYQGPFRIKLKQVGVVEDFETGNRTANAQFELAWEPRLRPMLLAVKSEEIKIIDDRDKPVMPQVMQEGGDVVLRPENPVAEMNLNLTAPDRAAKSLKSVKVKGEVTVPAGLKTFKFPTLAANNVEQKVGEISVKLESTEVDEQVWKVNVSVAYKGGGPAFESYRQGLFNNRIWLQKADGSRFEHNGGFNNTGSDEGKLSFEYLFVDAPGKPGDYQLVYETPSKVLTIPVDFEFKDIPLP